MVKSMEEKTLKLFNQYMAWINKTHKVDDISNYVYWYNAIRKGNKAI